MGNVVVMDEDNIDRLFSSEALKAKNRETNPTECPAVRRLQLVLEYYHDFIESNVGMNGINNMKNRGFGMYTFIARSLGNSYSTVRLLDDYHHILSKYFNQFEVVHDILTENIEYDISTSIIFKRINRNRQLCAFQNDRRCDFFGGYNASEEVSVQKLC